MIYVTGDLHGDITRFKDKEFKKLRRKDTLIVCGDFGFIWDGSKNEKKILKKLGKKKYNILFIDGANDNLNLIEEYSVSEWSGGAVREISGKLKYLCRGNVFNIEDKKIFVFGGGESESGQTINNQKDWYDKLFPTKEELEATTENLKKCDYSVDYIITHQSGRRLKQLIIGRDTDANFLDIFFDKIRTECQHKGWIFASYHIDKIIPPKELAIYQKVVSLQDNFDLSSLV